MSHDLWHWRSHNVLYDVLRELNRDLRRRMELLFAVRESAAPSSLTRPSQVVSAEASAAEARVLEAIDGFVEHFQHFLLLDLFLLLFLDKLPDTHHMLHDTGFWKKSNDTCSATARIEAPICGTQATRICTTGTNSSICSTARSCGQPPQTEVLAASPSQAPLPRRSSLEVLGACVLVSPWGDTGWLLSPWSCMVRCFSHCHRDGHPLVAKPLTEPSLPPPQCGARNVFNIHDANH